MSNRKNEIGESNMKDCTPDNSRRAFIKAFGYKALYFFGIVALCYPVFSFITFRKPRKRDVVFRPEEQLSPVTYKEGVYLVNKGEKTYAVSSRCTHLGCTVSYSKLSRRFRCPCHGSTFDIQGKWISGPAQKDLPRYPVTRKDNKAVKVTMTL